MPVSETGPNQVLSPVSDHQAQLAPVPWPPSCDSGKSPSKRDVPYQPRVLPLPLWETALRRPFAAASACVQASTSAASMIVLEFGFGKEDTAMVYISPDLFYDAFEEELNLCKWSFDRHHTADLSLLLHNGCLYLGRMTPNSPGAKVDKWRIHLCGAWLIRIGSSTVSTIAEAQVVEYCSGYYKARRASWRASGKKYKAQIVIFRILLTVNRFSWIYRKVESH